MKKLLIISLMLLATSVLADDTTLTNLSIDAYVANSYGSYQNRVFGTGTALQSIDLSGAMYGMMIKWDLSFIPDGSSIDSVLVTMYGNTENEDVGVVRITTDWIEGNVTDTPVLVAGQYGSTWLLAKDYYTGEGTDANWANGTNFSASDFDPNGYSYYGRDTTGVAGVNYVIYLSGANIKTLFSNWVNGIWPNYGFGLYSIDGGSAVFRSKEAAALRPLLYVAWTPGAGGGGDTTTSNSVHLGNVHTGKVW